MLKYVLKSVSVLLLVIVVLTNLFLLTGCSSGVEQKLIAHEWVSYSGSASVTYTFFENGTFKMSKTGFTTGTKTGTWKINGNELTLSTFNKPFTFKDIGDNEVDESEFDLYEWFVSDQFLYLYSCKYIAQN